MILLLYFSWLIFYNDVKDKTNVKVYTYINALNHRAIINN